MDERERGEGRRERDRVKRGRGEREGGGGDRGRSRAERKMGRGVVGLIAIFCIGYTLCHALAFHIIFQIR